MGASRLHGWSQHCQGGGILPVTHIQSGDDGEGHATLASGLGLFCDLPFGCVLSHKGHSRDTRFLTAVTKYLTRCAEGKGCFFQLLADRMQVPHDGKA